MLQTILLVYILGCIATSLCIAITHYTLGKEDSYYRVDQADLKTIVKRILFSWLTISFYTYTMLIKYENKPKDSCNKG